MSWDRPRHGFMYTVILINGDACNDAFFSGYINLLKKYIAIPRYNDLNAPLVNMFLTSELT